MPRKVFISSDMAIDEGLYDVSQENSLATLLWPWMISYFDDWGRALLSPKRIKSQLFPNVGNVTVEDIEESIRVYAEHGLVECYADESHEYMAIPSNKWFHWQTHIRKEKRVNDNSKYPPCPSDTNNAQVRDDARERAQKVKNQSSKSEIHTNDIPTPTPSPTPSKDCEVVVIDDVEKKLNQRFQMTFGRPPNDIQISKLSLFVEKGMDVELVMADMEKTRLKGKDLVYTVGILNKQWDRGIRTIAQMEAEEAEYQTAAGGGTFEYEHRIYRGARESPGSQNSAASFIQQRINQGTRV